MERRTPHSPIECNLALRSAPMTEMTPCLPAHLACQPAHLACQPTHWSCKAAHWSCNATHLTCHPAHWPVNIPMAPVNLLILPVSLLIAHCSLLIAHCSLPEPGGVRGARGGALVEPWWSPWWSPGGAPCRWEVVHAMKPGIPGNPSLDMIGDGNCEMN